MHAMSPAAILSLLRRRPKGFSYLRYQRWAIGLYRGPTLDALVIHPQVINPVLTAEDITDVEARFVADPFLLRTKTEFLMFFEVMNRTDRKGDIGLARSPDGLAWTYAGIILDAPFHLSYPYAFEWDGTVYLLPETIEPAAVTLYAAETFPLGWTPRQTLLSGRYVDPSIARFHDRWWLFVGEGGNDTLRLFCSDTLAGPFREHPRSPIVAGDRCAARPAGRVFVLGDRVIRSAQICEPIYGTGVALFEVTTLTPDTYEERPLGTVLAGCGSGWNAAGMHHLDAIKLDDDSFLAAVDGWHAARRVPWRRTRTKGGRSHA